MNALAKKKLKIEMIHDIVCSWCPIGYRNIKTAIDSLNIEVDFHFIPFELNPEMEERGELIASYFNRQFGWNTRKLQEYQQSLVKTAAKADVNIDFSKRKYYYNTHKAHLLMYWAERFNKQNELNERLIEAYFEHGKDISKIEILLIIAEQVGLDRALTANALSSVNLGLELGIKVKRRNVLNIQNIPAFLVSGNILISGSNSVETFEKTLSNLVLNLELNSQ